MVLKVFTVPAGKSVRVKEGRLLFTEGQQINLQDFTLPDHYTDASPIILSEEDASEEKSDTDDEHPPAEPSEAVGTGSDGTDSAGDNGHSTPRKRARKSRGT